MEKLKIGLLELIEQIGENPQREALKKTPDRVQSMLSSFLVGYKPLEHGFFRNLIPFGNTNHFDLIKIDPIPFCSLCEHHLVPFFGTIKLAYIPKHHILGLSHFSSYINHTSKRLLIQERLGREVVESFYSGLEPFACLIKIVATHSCLAMSGQHPNNLQMTTYHFQGEERFRSELKESLNE